MLDSVDPICAYNNSGLWASEKVLRCPEKTDASPLLNASAKTQLVFQTGYLGRTGNLYLQYTVLNKNDKINKFNTLKEQRWLWVSISIDWSIKSITFKFELSMVIDLSNGFPISVFIDWTSRLIINITIQEIWQKCCVNLPLKLQAVTASISLPRSRFQDVTQRGALRDIQKTAARETTLI